MGRIVPFLLIFLFSFRLIAEALSHPEPSEVPIAGPVRIETVYPVLNLDPEVVEPASTIEDGFSLQGKTLLYSQSARQHFYFSSPLSYPYKFSPAGLNLLLDRLRNIPYVDPQSIKVEILPTIPKSQQYLYRPEDLQALLIEEPYIRFKIKEWNTVTFMKFPTFVVAAFDRIASPVQSYDDYKALATDWQTKIKSFATYEDLREVLDISRQKQKWSNVPLLTFVSLYLRDEIAFENRYFFGSEPWEERSQRFLKEISPHGINTDRGSPLSSTVWGCNGIYHEQGLSVWRVYYSKEAVFYDGSDWPVTVIGISSHTGTLNRVLRSALFANVTLPAVLETTKTLSDDLDKRIIDIQAQRADSFRVFSFSRLDELFSIFRAKQERLPQVTSQIDRIERSLEGVDQLRQYFLDPFSLQVDTAPPQNNQRSIPTKDPCSVMFSFDERPSVNDRYKVNSLAVEIRVNLVSIKKKTERLSDEIKGGIDFLENRRGILENHWSNAFALLLPALSALIIDFVGKWYLLRSRKLSSKRKERIVPLLPFIGAFLGALIWVVLLLIR